jgi:hypothetical protein
MDPDLFRDLLKTRTSEDIVQELLYDPSPFCYYDNNESYLKLRKKICEKFQIHPQNFTIVGSAKIGFSLDPKNHPRVFQNNSDIDIVLVSEDLFQKIWFDLLKIEKEINEGRLRLDAVRAHNFNYIKKLIFQGWIRMDVIYETFDFARDWWDFFNCLSREEFDSAHEIHAAVFRTWMHASIYYEESIFELRGLYEGNGE